MQEKIYIQIIKAVFQPTFVLDGVQGQSVDSDSNPNCDLYLGWLTLFIQLTIFEWHIMDLKSKATIFE